MSCVFYFFSEDFLGMRQQFKKKKIHKLKEKKSLATLVCQFIKLTHDKKTV